MDLISLSSVVLADELSGNPSSVQKDLAEFSGLVKK